MAPPPAALPSPPCTGAKLRPPPELLHDGPQRPLMLAAGVGGRRCGESRPLQAQPPRVVEALVVHVLRGRPAVSRQRSAGNLIHACLADVRHGRACGGHAIAGARRWTQRPSSSADLCADHVGWSKKVRGEKVKGSFLLFGSVCTLFRPWPGFSAPAGNSSSGHGLGTGIGVSSDRFEFCSSLVTTLVLERSSPATNCILPCGMYSILVVHLWYVCGGRSAALDCWISNGSATFESERPSPATGWIFVPWQYNSSIGTVVPGEVFVMWWHSFRTGNLLLQILSWACSTEEKATKAGHRHDF